MSIFVLTRQKTTDGQQQVDVSNSQVSQNQQDEPKLVPDDERKDYGYVVLDGILSQVYTEALNKVLSRESTDMMITSELAKDLKETPAPSTYVYSIRSKDINDANAIQVAEKLTLSYGGDDKVKKILAIECDAKRLPEKAARIAEYVMSLGHEVIFTQRKVIDMLKRELLC